MRRSPAPAASGSPQRTAHRATRSRSMRQRRRLGLSRMSVKRLREESGYSLVEVMVAIVLLAIAILPMFAMFDTGLKSANRGSNYDKARALANKQLEQARSLSYGTVRTSFPNAPCAFDNGGLCVVGNLQDPDGEF